MGFSWDTYWPSDRYHSHPYVYLSWDEESKSVIGEMDSIGIVILGGYLIWELTKSHFLGYWVEGSILSAIILGITAGSIFARVLSNKRNIEQILKALEI
jgi:hypothetical protein